jgi:hypothetical protein
MLRAAWHFHHALSVVIGSVFAATLVVGITFSLIAGPTAKHPSVAPHATGPSRPGLGRMFDPDHIDETIDTLLSLDQRIDADRLLS